MTFCVGIAAERCEGVRLERVERVRLAALERQVGDEAVADDAVCGALICLPSSSESVAGIGIAPGTSR